MRSAFCRGIELLSEQESGSVQSQEKVVENPPKSTSEYMEGISGVPKNVTQLKPILGELMHKVIVAAIWPISTNVTQDLPKGADQKWRAKAKQNLEWLRKELSKEEEFLKTFMTLLDVRAPRNLQDEFSNEETDKS